VASLEAEMKSIEQESAFWDEEADVHKLSDDGFKYFSVHLVLFFKRF